MMNKRLLAILLLAPMITLAATTSIFNPEKEGLPLPDGGIKVMPIKKMATLGTPSHIVLTAYQQMKIKGFYEVDNPEASVIISMRHLKALKAGSNNPEDSNVKSTIADVGLAFEFKGVPVKEKNVIGYAASGSYEKGWTGVTEIFTDRELGVCQYTLNNIRLSHGSELVPQEVVSNDINGKVTTVDVRGNINSGYNLLNPLGG